MRSVFDEEEKQEGSRQRRDKELTLGSGTLLAIFFGLVLLCGLCFGMGYAVGHNNSGLTAITAPQPAPDQEPLQGSGTIPKPSAIAQTPVTPPDEPAADQAATDSGATPAQASAPAAGAAANGNSANQPQVRPALASSTTPPGSATGAAQGVHQALGSQSLMVQVAAISNPDDAEVLVDALRKRNYPVTAHRDPGDDFIHVRVGPFTTRAIAEQWRMKLLNDGYNAVVQP